MTNAEHGNNPVEAALVQPSAEFGFENSHYQEILDELVATGYIPELGEVTNDPESQITSVGGAIEAASYKKSENCEDYLYVDRERKIGIVADGVSKDGGKFAAFMGTRAFHAHLTDLGNPASGERYVADPALRMHTAAELTHATITQAKTLMPTEVKDVSGSSTTLTVVMLEGNKLVTYNTGDSGAFGKIGSDFARLTVDQSREYRPNIVTNTIGWSKDPIRPTEIQITERQTPGDSAEKFWDQVTVTELPPGNDYRVALLTDGVIGDKPAERFPLDRMESVVSSYPPDEAAVELIKQGSKKIDDKAAVVLEFAVANSADAVTTARTETVNPLTLAERIERITPEAVDHGSLIDLVVMRDTLVVHLERLEEGSAERPALEALQTEIRDRITQAELNQGRLQEEKNLTPKDIRNQALDIDRKAVLRANTEELDEIKVVLGRHATATEQGPYGKYTSLWADEDMPAIGAPLDRLVRKDKHLLDADTPIDERVENILTQLSTERRLLKLPYQDERGQLIAGDEATIAAYREAVTAALEQADEATKAGINTKQMIRELAHYQDSHALLRRIPAREQELTELATENENDPATTTAVVGATAVASAVTPPENTTRSSGRSWGDRWHDLRARMPKMSLRNNEAPDDDPENQPAPATSTIPVTPHPRHAAPQPTGTTVISPPKRKATPVPPVAPTPLTGNETTTKLAAVVGGDPRFNDDRGKFMKALDWVRPTTYAAIAGAALTTRQYRKQAEQQGITNAKDAVRPVGHREHYLDHTNGERRMFRAADIAAVGFLAVKTTNAVLNARGIHVGEMIEGWLPHIDLNGGNNNPSPEPTPKPSSPAPSTKPSGPGPDIWGESGPGGTNGQPLNPNTDTNNLPHDKQGLPDNLKINGDTTHIDRGEGWDHIFKDMGINKEGTRDDVLDRAGKSLEKSGDAYWDKDAKEWRVNLHGDHHVSNDGVDAINKAYGQELHDIDTKPAAPANPVNPEATVDNPRDLDTSTANLKVHGGDGWYDILGGMGIKDEKTMDLLINKAGPTLQHNGDAYNSNGNWYVNMTPSHHLSDASTSALQHYYHQIMGIDQLPEDKVTKLGKV